MTEADNDIGPAQPLDRLLLVRIVGVALALLPMLVRLQTPLEITPYWDGDPVNREAFVIGMTPAVSLMGDLVSIAGAAVLIASSDRRRAKALVPVVLAGIGAWACLWWAPQKGFEPKAAMAVGAWTSGVAAALGLWFAGKDRRVRLLAFALIAGAVGLLAMRGAYECFVQHPATVETFQKNKAQIFADNGWSPDSSMAKSYERRILQTEATGWFGFANVYASFAAMGLAVFASLLIGALKAKREADESGDETSPWPTFICGAGALLSAGALAMAGAKGGYAAAVLGLVVGGLLLWLRTERGARWRRAAWVIGPLAIIGPVLAVVARGAIGEKVGELSILFRWYYMEGAARIFWSHPAHGVGPDGFQMAYSLAKNPLSPEDVTSPHCLPWDWIACLGLGGIAWVAWLLCMSWKVGPAALAGAEDDARAGETPAPHTEVDDTRVLMRVVCLIAAAAAMVSIPMQYAALLPEEALGVRIGGLVAWCVLSCGALAVARVWSGWPVALAAGAVVLLAHTQIELTGALVQSCGLLLAVVALAASGTCSARGDALPGAPRTGAALAPRILGVVGCLGAAFMLLGTTQATAGGQVLLRKTYGLLGPVRTAHQKLDAAVRDHSPDAPQLAAQLREMEPITLGAVARLLPPSWPLARSASQMTMQLSQGYASEGQRALALAWGVRAVEYAASVPDERLDGLLTDGKVTDAEAQEAFARMAAAAPGWQHLDSSRAGWAATLCLAAAERGGGEPRAWLEAALVFLKAAEARDPYNPFHVQRRMDALITLGRTAEAQAAARRLLEVDGYQRLDRTVRGLSERERARAERIASGK